MLSAKEVRAIAEAHRAEIVKQQKAGAIEFLDSEVMPRIEDCARWGKTSIFITVRADVHTESVMEKLTELGYVVRSENRELFIGWE